MLDKIPFEIQLEIMKRLPVRSVIQFRSVSKAWKLLINSPDFITRYTALNPDPQHLLVIEANLYDDYRFAIVSDDDSFPQRRVIFTTKEDSTFSRLLNWLRLTVIDYKVVGSSHGLLCFYGDHREGRGGHRSLTGMTVLWNPSIRKAVSVIVPNLGGGKGMYQTTVGFGVCDETMDPKIVKIKYVKSEIDAESVSYIPRQVEVFTLSTGVWRRPYRNRPRKSVQFGCQPQVVVDGFLYWLASEKITRDGGYSMSYTLIVSFDITTEEFREVSLPDSLALAKHNNHILKINRLRNSLVVIDHNKDANNPVMDIWMRVDGVFTKLFNLEVNTRNEFITGFRKNGAPVVEIEDTEEENVRELVVYEPNSEHIGSLWIHLAPSWVFVYPYMETLLLLDQPDLMVYNDISMWRAKNKNLLKHTS
ncbi:hypothetical protein SSX86_009815 [Deinandra increscens subsp. villosa]|uniref:F-box domain-containing protein n=1 Tax=Deinandra increscens subsp. villosa TaxID=3103831 RepID=A0AAP0H4E9_9ASTR